jgi:hypothetical protein
LPGKWRNRLAADLHSIGGGSHGLNRAALVAAAGLPLTSRNSDGALDHLRTESSVPFAWLMICESRFISSRENVTGTEPTRASLTPNWIVPVVRVPNAAIRNPPFVV